MKTINIFLMLIAVGVIALSSCNKDEDIYNPPDNNNDYILQVPVGFPDMYIPADNKPSERRVALGRMLFYDFSLDKDSLRSCASCHVQSTSFTSDGGNHQILPHMNFAWSNNYMWNGSMTGTLEDVMLFEVEEFFKTDLDRINNNLNYSNLFKEAFNVDAITSKELAYAMAQFERTMISDNSMFDKNRRGEVALTNEEQQGLKLFYSERGDCFHCHGTALFTDNIVHNNGLDETPVAGYHDVTGDLKDLGKYKTPSLRNVEYTAPYMHDGRFSSLEEVVEFYSTGIQNSETVDPFITYAHQGGLQLTYDEKAALVAFLKTLTDPDFFTNPELSNPF
jgi:cytochrome c peroxidase